MSVLTQEQFTTVLSKIKSVLSEITAAETVTSNTGAETAPAKKFVAQDATEEAAEATQEAVPVKKFVAQDATEEAVPVKKAVAQNGTSEAYTSSGGRRRKRTKRVKRRRGTRR